MEVLIYLDSLFLLNFMINLWILQLVKLKYSLEVCKGRILFAALLGASMYILAFTLPLKSIFLQPLSVAVSVPCMMRTLLPRKRWKYRIRLIGSGFFYVFVIAGILRVLFYKWRLFTGLEISISGVLGGTYICMRVAEIAMKRRKLSDKNVCQVVIKSAGMKTTLSALVDTGNSLLEPISKKPVSIVDEEILAKITLENPLFFRAIPYRSVGCENGTLYGVEVPEIRIFCENTCYVAKNIICAGTPHKLSTKGTYQMILHPALLTEGNLEDWKEEQNVTGERNEKNNIHACG